MVSLWAITVPSTSRMGIWANGIARKTEKVKHEQFSKDPYMWKIQIIMHEV